MGQSRPLFLLIFVFNMLQFKIQIDKSVDGVLGIRTRSGRMEGEDESTELQRYPK